MKVITLLNEKGGVGKTTLSTHLAAGLAMRGQRVLLMDTDAQANATSQLRLPESGGLYQLIVKEAEWASVLLSPERSTWAADGENNGSLWVLTSNLETRAIPMMTSDVTAIKSRLDEIKDYVDVVIVDTSPTPSLLHAMIFLISDYMIYPTQPELLSMAGVGKGIAHMTNMKQTRQAFGLKPTALMGVQVTMYQGNTLAHQHGIERIETHFGSRVWQPLPMRTVYREASYAMQTVFSYAPTHEASEDLWQYVARVENQLGSRKKVQAVNHG